MRNNQWGRKGGGGRWGKDYHRREWEKEFKKEGETQEKKDQWIKLEKDRHSKNYEINRKMYLILISNFFVQFVHRTTYKRFKSNLLIAKNILLFDARTPHSQVSSICMPPLISYQNTVMAITIINHGPLTISVSELVPLQNSSCYGILSNISLSVTLGVSGYHPKV